MPAPLEADASRAAAVSADTAAGLAGPLTPLAADSLAFLVMSLAHRLHRGASVYYLRHFQIGMPEFRTVMALGRCDGLKVGEVALAADVDTAAASRSLKALRARGLVQMAQTPTRGRAAIVHLTEAGRAFERRVRRAAHRRERRFVANLSSAEHRSAIHLIHKLIGNLPVMNQDCVPT